MSIEKEKALELIKIEYARLDELCKVDSSSVDISLSSRMTKKFGCFEIKYSKPNPKLSIRISEKILPDEELFYDVIRHEYAHALVYLRDPKGKHMHDEVWKAACLEVGCEPKATVKNIATYLPVKEREDKYIIRCLNCGTESKYRSKSKVIKILLKEKRGTVVCNKCGSTKFEFECIDQKST